jgi:hypothetical protein
VASVMSAYDGDAARLSVQGHNKTNRSTQFKRCSVDHLVGKGLQRLRYGQVKRLAVLRLITAAEKLSDSYVFETSATKFSLVSMQC